MKKVDYKGEIKENSEGIYREENGQIILGKAYPIYIHNLNYYLAELKIYADGMIDCWEMVDFDEFKHKIESDWVITELPESAEVSVFPLGSFTATDIKNSIKPEELIKEVSDVIAELNSKPTTSVICQKAFEAYQTDPSEANKTELKEAYEAIPEHNRIYVLGDMDNKDRPIRVIIYEE